MKKIQKFLYPSFVRIAGTLLTLTVLITALMPAAPVLASAPPQDSSTFWVDSYEDNVNLSACTIEPGDCSLRGAVQKANQDPAANTIYLPNGMYVVGGARNENKNQTGDLDILTSGSDLYIQGEDPRGTIIRGDEASGLDRLLDVPEFSTTITLHLKNLTLRSGDPGTRGDGGAVRDFGGLTLENVNVEENAARLGGGVYFYNPYNMPLSIKNTSFSGNRAIKDGGGLYNWGNTAIKNSLFADNQADRRGGAIFNMGQIEMEASTLYNNTAPNGGGLVNLVDGSSVPSIHLNNITFWKNSTAIYQVVNKSLISKNAKYFSISNSILAGSSSDKNCLFEVDNNNEITVEDDASFLKDEGNNLDSGQTCNLAASIKNTDPRLGELDDYGGPTRTVALKSDSPAVDAASPATCTNRDQRFLAAVGTCDMGAFEYGAAPILQVSTTTSNTLKLYLTNAYNNPLADWIVSYEAPEGSNMKLSQQYAMTDANGMAFVDYTLPEGAGQYVVKATSGSKTVSLVVDHGGAVALHSSSAKKSLPDTGFAPGMVTHLPASSRRPAAAQPGELSLEVPDLGINIPIVGAPQDESGSWNLDWLANQAGYLEGTAFPTHAGNSVLAGHAALANGQPGPFSRLSSLAWGNTIIIHAWGERYIYSVRSIQSVPAEDTSALRHEDQPWLTLITCQKYDDQQKRYQERLVVSAVLLQVVSE